MLPPTRVRRWFYDEVWAATPAFLHLCHDVLCSTRADRLQTLDGPTEAAIARLRDAGTLSLAPTLGYETVSPDSDVRIYGNVGVVPIAGPIARYASLFTRMSGGQTLESIAEDVTRASLHDGVDTIVLSIDSPGGQATGILELAMYLRERIPDLLVAYVEGAGMSAAYALAAAADEIVLGPMAQVGSVGVATILPGSEDRESIELISSMTPDKRPDPSTDEGRALLQKRVDDMGQEFVQAVADLRNLDYDQVAAWRGGVQLGQAAIEAGMADRIGTLADVIEELQARGNDMPKKAIAQVMADSRPAADPKTPVAGDDQVNDAPESPEVVTLDTHKQAVEAAVNLAVNSEIERIQGVLAQAAPDLADELGDEIWSMLWDRASHPGDVAIKVLAQSRAKGDAVVDGRQAPVAIAPKVSDTKPSASAPKIDDQLPPDEQAKAAWDADPKLRDEFMSFDDYLAFDRADRANRVRFAPSGGH